MNLPGVCVVCRAPVVWRGKSWKNPGQWGQRHRCPADRPICGAMMRYAGERCARKPGHTTEHRTAYALANDARSRGSRSAVALR
jgi:hypothetical protein